MSVVSLIIAAVCLLSGMIIGAIVKSVRSRFSCHSDEHQSADSRKRLKELENGAILAGEKIRNFQQNLTEQKAAAGNLARQNSALSAELTDLKIKYSAQKVTIAERELRLSELQQQFNEQKKAMKEEFRLLSEEILREKEEMLIKDNRAGLGSLLEPLKNQINQFHRRINEVHGEQSKNAGRLQQQLFDLGKTNSSLKEEAEKLAKALKNNKKALGNWGELQIEKLLEDCGLTAGREYKREENYKNSEGDNRRPDFVIHLPNDKHIIIDSKVSLNDYVAGINAESQTEQTAALTALVGCVKQHIDRLSGKNYTALTGINAPDFVFMFMPIETAYSAALETDITLFDYAFERKVAIVTPGTLLPILRTVASLWNIEKQNRSSRELAQAAGRVYDRLGIFTQKFIKMESAINALGKHYVDAQRSLSGPKSLTRSVERFKEFGVKTHKQLPRDYPEADLPLSGRDSGSQTVKGSRNEG